MRSAPSTATRSQRSIVQFPRFQYEIDPNTIIYKRKRAERAAALPWLSESSVQAVLLGSRHMNILTKENLDQMATTGWWGQYHRAEKRDSRIYDMPSLTRGAARQAPGLWVTNYQHEYCWDQQALPGQKLEIVLHGFANTLGPADELVSTTREHGALLIDPTKPELQRFVLADGETWRAPRSGEIKQVSSMLEAITLIALREVSLATVDNRGENL